MWINYQALEDNLQNCCFFTIPYTVFLVESFMKIALCLSEPFFTLLPRIEEVAFLEWWVEKRNCQWKCFLLIFFGKRTCIIPWYFSLGWSRIKYFEVLMHRTIFAIFLDCWFKLPIFTCAAKQYRLLVLRMAVSPIFASEN